MKKELGSYPADFEFYFLMWDSVLFYPQPGQVAKEILYGHAGELGSIPCHRHNLCGALVKAETKYPPKQCPHCGMNTEQQYERLSEEEKENAEIRHGLRPARPEEPTKVVIPYGGR